MALLTLTACASDGPPHRGERFDGPPPQRPSLFVSPAGEPFRAGPGEPYPVVVWFRKADADGDGKLTRDEFLADAARFFQRLDANRDGVVDGVEIKAYENEILPEITADRGGPGERGEGPQTFQPRQGGGGRRGGGRRRGGGGGAGGPPSQGGGGGPGPSMPLAQGASPYGLLGEREPVAGADLNLNSRITLANFKTRAGQRFALLDTEGRGYLLMAELPKTAIQRQGERRGGGRRPPG